MNPADYHNAGIITHAEKQALELIYGQPPLSQRQTAQALGISRTALRSRLRNALRKIARHTKEAA